MNNWAFKAVLVTLILGVSLYLIGNGCRWQAFNPDANKCFGITQKLIDWYVGIK